MKIFLLFFVLIFTQFISQGQNLVNNSSFEEYAPCPDTEGEIPYATGWENWLASPDYFNECAPVYSPSDVPYSCYNSFQYAHTGVAYAGLFIYWTKLLSSSYPWIREEIGTQLNQPLQIGTKYYLTMFVSLASFIPTPCSSNNLGVKFTTQSFASYGNGFITPLVNNDAPILVDSMITDTANWVKVTGSFVADSAYQYMVIGNFFDNDHTDTAILGTVSLCYSYYFIDDVCLSIDSVSCFTKTEIDEPLFAMKIYPNPFSEQCVVELPSYIEPTEIVLLNVFGETIKVQVKQVNTQGKRTIFINRDNLPAGVYLLKIKTKQKDFLEQLVIQ